MGTGLPKLKLRGPKFVVATITIIAVILTIIALIYIDSRYESGTLDIPKYNHEPLVPNKDTGVATGTQSSILNPKSLNLKVPFSPQAPTANWDELHNEACEETSAIMANAYFNGPKDVKLAPDYVETQLAELTTWEKTAFGYYLDINSEETARLIEANYGLKAKVVTDVSESNIKNELSQNHLVLFPANGQRLGNPNYKQPGPKYHMLVIRGFTATSIITNDPGTRNGLNYSYSYNTLYQANGVWDHSIDEVDLSQKNMIVVWK